MSCGKQEYKSEDTSPGDWLKAWDSIPAKQEDQQEQTGSSLYCFYYFSIAPGKACGRLSEELGH